MAIVELSALKAKFEPGDSPKSSDFINLIDTLAALPEADVAANGIPSGGTTGQVLVKVDGTNYNTQWSTPDLSGKQDVVANVSSTEIGYLDGVTSAIQTQINTKAPTADPTFTGTVSGVTKTHVGLGNVDNTSDASKPVSTATQTALDLKSNLSGPTFTGTVVLPSTTSIGDVSSTELSYLNNVTSAIQTQIDAKSPLDSPTFTGTPAAPLAVTGTNTTQIATTSFVQQELSVLTSGAPAALNTLDELAAALGDDSNYAATITTALGLKAPLASPTFTGTPTLPTGTIATTQTAGNSTTAVATTAFVTTADNLKANLAGPTFTGTVTIPTLDVTTKLIAEQSFTVALSDETTSITTGTSKVTFRAPFAMTLTKIPRASLANAGTGTSTVVDINKSGTSILSTKLTIDATQKTSTTSATTAVLSSSTINDDEEITIDIDAAGTAARGLKVTIFYKRS